MATATQDFQATLLKILLANCINDRKMLAQAYGYCSNPFGFTTKPEYCNPLIKEIGYCGNKKVLKKHKLKNVIERAGDYCDKKFSIKFDSEPPLKLFYKAENTENSVEILEFQMKSFFGRIRYYKVERRTRINKPAFALTHGTIETSISVEEANEFFEIYKINLNNIIMEIDMERLQNRVSAYSKKQ